MSDYTPTTEPSRVEKIMDTLAYYQCRETNPKADHPTMGYHAFSEDQRKFLQERKREAAEELDRWYADEIRTAKAEARAESLTKARAHLDRIAPNGLTNKASVLAALEMWADRAKRGYQPNGTPYTEES